MEETFLRNIVNISVTCALRPYTIRKYSRPSALLRLTDLFFNLKDWNDNLTMKNDKLSMLTVTKLTYVFKCC